jgi:hypothetical protein
MQMREMTSIFLSGGECIDKAEKQRIYGHIKKRIAGLQISISKINDKWI